MSCVRKEHPSITPALPSPTPPLTVLAYDPGVSPKEGGLPGLEVLRSVVNSINLFGIVAVVGALAVSLGVWAWGHHTGGHQAEANGKKGAVVSAGAALGLGAANGIVAFFSTLGTTVQ
ncbi:hypothetical protein ACFH04_13545 [Streptomyces noboritoensis]|uniref:Integral membrane protein n=1 Tax=Streptomyces noboritoensis TaxID=67337 RepID=A0ABV6TG02_9ACTN